jgi:hypothetical protein
MPIFKVICQEEFRDDFYELKISEKVMFTVQLVRASYGASSLRRELLLLDSD